MKTPVMQLHGVTSGAGNIPSTRAAIWDYDWRRLHWAS